MLMILLLYDNNKCNLDFMGKKMNRHLQLVVMCFLIVSATHAQDTLRLKLEHVLASTHADVGVAVYGFEKGDTISIQGNKHYPMQSVFKFHVALAVLKQVDQRKFSLDQPVFIKKEELLPDTWSLILQQYPEGNVYLTLAEIIRFTVALSDNNGCDILLRLIGGPQVVHDFIHSLGVTDVAIQHTEEQMHRGWEVQFANWTTPKAAADLLYLFYTKNIISEKSSAFLRKTMEETSTGAKRIKGLLPANTVVAHKTGTSGTNQAGITAAVNDIGVVTVSDSKKYAICVFVSNSTASMEENEHIIASVSQLVWNYFQAGTR